MELASYYQVHGKLDEAIGVYEDLYRSNPHSQLAANNLAMLLVNYKTDRASLDQARELAAQLESSNDGALLDTAGWVHFKRGEVQQALPVLERAAARAPDAKVIQYHLAMAELQAGQRDQARTHLKSALDGNSAFAEREDARSALRSLEDGAG